MFTKFNALLTALLVGGLVSFSTETRAQDYIKHSLYGVEKALKSEGARYEVIQEPNRILVVLAEESDTAIWKFGLDEICYDYTLIMNNEELMDVSNHLLLITRKVNGQFINIRERTITSMVEMNGQLILNTREFSIGQMIALLKDKPEYADVLAMVNEEAKNSGK